MAAVIRVCASAVVAFMLPDYIRQRMNMNLWTSVDVDDNDYKLRDVDCILCQRIAQPFKIVGYIREARFPLSSNTSMVENRSDFLEPRMRRKEQQGRWFSVVALIGSAASEQTPACYVPVVYEGNASTKYAERKVVNSITSLLQQNNLVFSLQAAAAVVKVHQSLVSS
ncbi:hypothetical protein HZH68_005061 [Vespula germanica]|uniref:Uncharacterized protein n=1 Tax=Vespula germanica TaxID=30212 RepID=A0A834NDX0_VESGE|nr:hypothetical protein HZH68_005061 [Vespula germanica]